MPDIERGSTEARLLALLTSTPGRELHTRELVRRVRGSPRPVYLALEKLARQGLLESRRMGPLRLWRMDPKHPLYRSLRELYARTIGVGARIAEILERQEAVDLAFIFGSYARAEDDLTSDIDVFVLGEPDWRPLEDEAQKLQDELGREVNFVAWHSRDLARAVKDRSPFLGTLRKARKIWIVGGQDEFDRRIKAVGREVRRGRSATERRRGRAGEKARTRPQEPRTRTRGARGR